MNFRNKRILITAGPTWVPIDAVRVISNIATGQTGILLANELTKYGAKITLVLGPVGDVNDIDKNVRLIRFIFFDEFKNIILNEIKSMKYDVMVHTAAVSDYKPKVFADKKIRSGIKNLKLILEPTPKIIDSIKKINPGIFLVGFKFMPNASKDELLDQAQRLMSHSKSDLIVANTLTGNSYRAYIMSRTYPDIDRREGGAFAKSLRQRSEDDGIVAETLLRGRTTQPIGPEQMTLLPTRSIRIGSKGRVSALLADKRYLIKGLIKAIRGENLCKKRNYQKSIKAG